MKIGAGLRPGISRAGLIALAVIAGGLLTACGSATPGQASRPATVTASAPALCSHQAAVDHLRVVRGRRYLPDHQSFSFPAAVSVREQARAKSVAAAVCALPRMPSRPMSCPGDTGVVYRLAFAAGERHFTPVRVEATGCQVVHGAGPARWVARTPAFWHVLGKAMGLTGSDGASFAGLR